MKAIAAAVVAVPLAVIISACGTSGTPQERVQRQADKLLTKIEASDQQKLVVKGAIDELTLSLKDGRELRKGTRQVVQAQIEAKVADERVLAAEADKIAKSFSDSAHAFIDAGATIHGALTPEQRVKLTAELKPGRGMRAAWFVAGRMGYGPPADKAEMEERAAERVEDMLDNIDATDKQREALRPLMLGLVDEALPLFERREAVMDAFIGAWNSEKPDVASLHALIDAESVRVNALLRSAASRFAAAHQVLTPDQRTKIAARMASGGGGCGGHDDDDDGDDSDAAVKN